MLLFDTSDIEAYVTENNPKYANRIVRQLKDYSKSMHFDSSYTPYKVAYASMPTSTSSNHEVKQQYINGYFCYTYKFGTIINGLGIVRSIDFYKSLFEDFNFTKAFIPLKVNLSMDTVKYTFDKSR